MHTVEEQFYIPLVDLSLDVDRIKQEIYRFVHPIHGDYALTCLEKDQNVVNFNFKKYSGQRVYTPVSPYLLSTGQMDYDLVYWPKFLQNSYIKEAGELIANYLDLKSPRCRLSVTADIRKPTTIGFHVDNHTPYRVHVVIETTEQSIWRFRQQPGAKIYILHQPISQHPALIATGNMEHDIYVPPGHRRLHLWYQFHDSPTPDQIDKLIEKYKLTKDKL